MTGMKEGAGEDPFADDDPVGDRTEEEEFNGRKGENRTEDDDSSPDEGVEGDARQRYEDDSGTDGRSVVPDDRDGRSGDDNEGESRAAGSSRRQSETGTGNETSSTTKAGGGTGAGNESDGGSEQRVVQIPYKLRRDSVQDGRNRVPLFLQKETKGAERDALRELEDRFDDDVSLTDLREALLLVGLERLDEVEEQLEQWGYGMTFDV